MAAAGPIMNFVLFFVSMRTSSGVAAVNAIIAAGPKLHFHELPKEPALVANESGDLINNRTSAGYRMQAPADKSDAALLETLGNVHADASGSHRSLAGAHYPKVSLLDGRGGRSSSDASTDTGAVEVQNDGSDTVQPGWIAGGLVLIAVPVLIVAGCMSLLNQVNTPSLVAGALAMAIGNFTSNRSERTHAAPDTDGVFGNWGWKATGSGAERGRGSARQSSRTAPPPAPCPTDHRNEDATEATQYRQWADPRLPQRKNSVKDLTDKYVIFSNASTSIGPVPTSGKIYDGPPSSKTTTPTPPMAPSIPPARPASMEKGHQPVDSTSVFVGPCYGN